MASDTDDAEAAADRLEAALQRIAEVALREHEPPPALPPGPAHTIDSEELAARLDELIDRLRAALGERAG
jgi:hypothetical protein